MSRRSEIREQWRRTLEEQRASGLSVAAFCRRAGVLHSGYYKWRRKLAGEGVFAEVKLAAGGGEATERGGAVADTVGIELWLPRDRRVVVRPGFDRRTLIELLHILEADSTSAVRRGRGV